MKRLCVLLWLLICTGWIPAQTQPIPTPACLSVAQMQRDISILQASLMNMHPGLYRYITPRQLQAHFRQLRQQASHPLPLPTFYRYLAQFTAKLHCGHTYPNPFNLTSTLSDQLFTNQLLPLYFRAYSGQWLVTHNLSANQQVQVGDVILAINQIPIRQVMDSLLTVSRSDGRHSQAKKLDNLNLTPATAASFALFDQYFTLFFPTSGADFTLTLQTPPAAPRQVTVAAVSKAERTRRYGQQFGPLPQKQASWQYRSIDARTAYLWIGDLAVWGWSFDARRYLDSVFTNIQQQRYTQLIVDIRGCEGGDDDTRNELLSYLMRQPFGCDNPTRRLYRSLTVADSLLPYLQTWDAQFKQPKSPTDYQPTKLGLYEKLADRSVACQPIAIKAKRFTGKLCLLVDGANSSTTFTLADWLQQAHVGRLVGSPTGGTKQGLNGGQFFFLHLPESQLEVDLPLVYQAPAQARPDQPVYPDRLVYSTRDDLCQQRDAVLQQALQEFTRMK